MSRGLLFVLALVGVTALVYVATSMLKSGEGGVDPAIGRRGQGAPDKIPEDAPELPDDTLPERRPGGTTEPEPPPPEFARAKTLADLNEREEAIVELDRILAIDPKNEDALRLRADLHLKSGMDRLAEADLRLLLRGKEERGVEDLQALAQAVVMRNAKGAEELLREAIKVEPRRARSHALLARALMRQDRRDEAQAAIGEALVLDPTDPLARKLAGRLAR